MDFGKKMNLPAFVLFLVTFMFRFVYRSLRHNLCNERIFSYKPSLLFGLHHSPTFKMGNFLKGGRPEQISLYRVFQKNITILNGYNFFNIHSR